MKFAQRIIPRQWSGDRTGAAAGFYARPSAISS